MGWRGRRDDEGNATARPGLPVGGPPAASHPDVKESESDQVKDQRKEQNGEQVSTSMHAVGPGPHEWRLET